jgi:hypothetical protein
VRAALRSALTARGSASGDASIRCAATDPAAAPSSSRIIAARRWALARASAETEAATRCDQGVNERQRISVVQDVHRREGVGGLIGGVEIESGQQ